MIPYSNRLSWSLSPNSFSELVRHKRESGVALCDLTVSNPTAVLPGYPHAEITQAFASIASFDYHPDPAGELFAREAVASYYARHNLSVPADRILLTASTSEAYSILFKLLCDPGDEVLVPVPSYPLFEYLASLESVRTVPYQLLFDGSWYFDFDHLERAISPRTRAIVLVSPNNPTGSYLKQSELLRLTDIAQRHGLALISDEVFLDYRFTNDTTVVPSLCGHNQIVSFSLNGLSKAAAMPQMKLGWIVMNGPNDELTAAKPKVELILDTFLSVGTPVQKAIPKLFEIGKANQRSVQERALQNLTSARDLLNNTPAHGLHVEGGWSLIVQMPRFRTDESWMTDLLNHFGVIVQPGYFFDLPQESCLVLSLITPPDIWKTGIRAIQASVNHPAIQA